KEVVISSDAEMLDAHGTDLVYDRSKQLTTLKGTPMWAIKEGTEIRAAELQLVNAKDHQKATALGEGHISLFDKTTNKRSMEASWKRSFVYTKEGNVDVLTLVGDAVFMDKERQQQLKAETLKVWLAPADPGTAAGGEEQRRKPQRLDALEHVSSEGPDLHIHDTEHLEVYFADVAPTPRERSAQGEATNAALSSRQENDTAAGDAKSKEGPGTIPAIAANRRPRPEGGLFPGAPAENGKNKKPIDLSAKLVQTY